MPDISKTLAPNSAQLDNIDLRGTGPRVFTITRVDVDLNSDQPVAVHFAEFDRPWKPGKNMRRVLAHCWGMETDDWVGRRVELFADETVKFGKETPGGTRISRLSHIPKPTKAPVLLSQGRAGLYPVDPLPDAPEPDPTTPEQILGEINAATTADEVRAIGNKAHSLNLLENIVEAETIRSHVTYRLAEFEQGGAA